jgi:hypothetical protein
MSVNEMNIVAGRENGDGFVRIAGLDDVKSRHLDGGSGTHPNQKFVLDNEHDRPFASAVLHQDRRLSLGRSKKCSKVSVSDTTPNPILVNSFRKQEEI